MPSAPNATTAKSIEDEHRNITKTTAPVPGPVLTQQQYQQRPVVKHTGKQSPKSADIPRLSEVSPDWQLLEESPHSPPQL